jgi:2-polyprenyl-6-methoxyphenol hydroxylase-like FAD-dependent oxidoreductase
MDPPYRYDLTQLDELYAIDRMSSLRVIVAGGGISGLLLAQGLKRSGIECVVLEREPADRRRSGYRLTLDADGGNALEACLPSELYDLYLRSSHRTRATTSRS